MQPAKLRRVVFLTCREMKKTAMIYGRVISRSGGAVAERHEKVAALRDVYL